MGFDMFRKNLISLFLFAILYSTSASAQAQLGRYLGVLKHSQIGNDQLAKIDFIASRQNGSELKLVALLTLYFGGYESTEYITYHFDTVTYNLLTGSLVFDQADQEVTLVVNRFGGGQFEGKLRSVSAGDVGTLSMAKQNSVTPSKPLVQPLWGEYRGICDGIGTVIQIQTQRSSNDSSRMGDPFGTYEISAQLAEINPAACLSPSNLCVTRTYNSGSYNFFKGKLELIGIARELECTVDTNDLSCGECRFKRTSNENAPFASQTFPIQVPAFSEQQQAPSDQPVATSPATLSGNYQGYLFHERLGKYQAVSLNIATYQGHSSDGTQSLFISAVSSMFFGGFDSKEYITHRFNEHAYPLLTSQIVLERINGDVDAIIELTQLGNGRARGIWYSLLFGRVGTFELSNTGVLPKLPNDAIMMDKIGGSYKGGGWNLDLQVIRESTPLNTVNPFYPLNFKGAFRFQDGLGNTRISHGSFDFYTGKLSFRLEDSSIFSGYRKDNDSLMLKRPTPGSSRPLLQHRPQTFMKVKL